MLALLQTSTNHVPGWLQVTAAVLLGLQSLFVCGGIAGALYRFRREKPHEGRLQPTVSGSFGKHDGKIYLVATVSAQNAGQVTIPLNLADTALDVYTRSARDEDWQHFDVFSVFAERGHVRPDETIEDQTWIEMPEDDKIGVKLELTIVGRDEERTVWPGIGLVSVLAKEGGNQPEDG